MKLQTIKVSDLKISIKKMKEKLTPYSSEAYIFGSVVFGYAIKEESDLDLLVVPKKRINLESVYKLLDSVVTQLLDNGIVLHVIIFNPERHSQELLETARKGLKIV